MKVLARVGVAFDNLEKALFAIACFLLAFTAVSTTVDVVARYFFHRPVQWISEINVYCVVYMTFLSAAWLQRKGWHIHMDMVINRLKPKGARRLEIAISVVGAILWLTIAFYSGDVTRSLFVEKWRIVSVLEPLKALIVGIIPVGSFLLGLQLIRETYNLVKSGAAEHEKVESEL
ncbi:MAG: TRAP transporter small permease subunit [Chloroflexota bacterium]|nr:TRAP transporter small permease subunit [Chloroflexota bacterium]